MTFEALRLWLYINKVRVHEQDGKLLRHFEDPAARVLETEEIRNALGRYRMLLQAIIRRQCPTCRWPLKVEQDESWRHDYCPKDITHFSSGVAYDGSFSCGLL